MDCLFKRSMDSIRLFLRSNSFRNSKRRNDLTDQYLRTNSNPGDINDLTIESQENQSSSNEKLSRENIKSFLSTHPSSTTRLSALPFHHLQLETCSGLSTPTDDRPVDVNMVASALDSISNAGELTDHSTLRRRRSSVGISKRRRSWLVEHNNQQTFRRAKSHRYADRIRKHSIKRKRSTERVVRHSSQVNR